MAIVTEEIEDTPVAVPVARTPTPDSVSETELMDSEVLPLSTHPGADMRINIQPVHDKEDTQYLPRDLHLIAILQHKHNGKHDHISTEQPFHLLYTGPYKSHKLILIVCSQYACDLRNSNHRPSSAALTWPQP